MMQRLPSLAIALAAAACALTLLACADNRLFVTADSDAMPEDSTDVVLYDEPLIVRFDAGSATDTPMDGGTDTADASDGFTCDAAKSPHDDPCVVDDAYGVFVAPAANGGSDSSGNGTKAAPYATIGHALGSVGGKTRVYVCNATYAEQIAWTSAVSLYGGLACPGADAGAVGWAYLGGLARVMSPSSDWAINVDGAISAISIEDMGFAAPSASGQDASGNGKSSVAALVSASHVAFRRCTFTAGAGDKGSDGAMGANYAAGAATAPDGNANGGAAGGIGGMVACTNGSTSAGGHGGDSSPDGGASGGGGVASPMPTLTPPADGKGGTGGVATCIAGDPGANGAAGAASLAAMGYGVLSLSGWTPSVGGDGKPGSPAQGGGGGGGKGLPVLGGTGGGAGGCGGAGGSGGKGGGASIALACIASIVTLDSCTFTTGNGGNGGKGGDGQPGQGGGTFGPAVGPCLGGYGGNGAGGGGGAGGTGGVSVCVAYQGNAPTGTPVCTMGTAGQPGGGGNGGAGGSNPLGRGTSGASGAAGLNGVAANIWQAQ